MYTISIMNATTSKIKDRVNAKESYKNVLSDEDKTMYIELMKYTNVSFFCPMCDNNDFVIAEGFFLHDISIKTEVQALSGKKIPTIPIICTKCGFISQHAVLVLHKYIKDLQKK